MLPPSRSLLLLALAGAGGVLCGQQAGDGIRRPTFVRVLDARGGAIANANVFLAGGEPHLGAVIGAIDTQVVASDARGRAQAKLVPGLCYVAWAVGPADAAGNGLVSAPFGYFGAGALFELRCVQPYGPRLLMVSGAGAWSDHGPLRYFVQSPYPGAEEELPGDAMGRLAVPPWPQAVIEVRSKDGQPLWSSPVADDLKIPPPCAIAVRVLDENGAPLAGVAIRLRVARRRPWTLDGLGGVVDGSFRDLAVTPANGKVTVTVPYAADPFEDQSKGELLLFASMPGRPAVAGGVFGRALYQDDRKVAAITNGEFVFTCKRQEPLVGQCRMAPEGTTAHLAAVCKLFSDRGSFTHDARSFTAMVGADGRFAFADVPSELHSCRLTLLPPASRAVELPLFAAMSGRTLPASVTVPTPGRAAPLDGTDVTTLRLRATDPDGGPARGVVAFLVPGDQNGVLLRDSLVRLPLDAAGSTTVSLVRGRWVVLVVSAAGHAASNTDLAGETTELTMAMQPLATMRLRLRDGNGGPIAGARVVARGSSTRASGDPVESMMQSVAAQARLLWGTLMTDDGGRVTIPFVPVNGVTNRIALAWDHGTTDNFELEANEVPLELRGK